jgi:acetyltransferase-like isoleucine patch superfamily enzyme
VVIDAEEVDIGPGVSIGFGTVIRGRRVRIDRRADIGSFCFFEGRDMVIGVDTVIREQVFVGGPLFPDSLLEIGKRVRVFQTCFLNPSKPLLIGDETGLGGRSSIFTHGSWQSVLEGYPVAFAPVTIGKNVWLPWHVFILPGVEIGDNATVGAGSVVNRSIPAGTLAAGVPAKVLREADEWPRPVDPDARWSIARSMVEDMLAFMEDHSVVVQRMDERRGRVAAALSYAGQTSRLALVGNGEAIEETDDVVLGLFDNPGFEYPADVSWFGLLDRRKGGPQTSVSEEVEDFVNRYGIRFTPSGES